MSIGSSTQEAIYQQSFIGMKDIFHHQSFGDIRRLNGKLRTFAILKNNLITTRQYGFETARGRVGLMGNESWFIWWIYATYVSTCK